MPNTTLNAEDINFINALIADVSTNHSVDANRIYGIGYSLGSMFSYEFACQMSNQFAAIASFAGTMPVNPTACDPQRFAPIMHIHGTDDSIIAYGNEWGWKSWPQVGDMRDIPSLLSYWREKYQCPTNKNRQCHPFCVWRLGANVMSITASVALVRCAQPN